MNRKGFSLIELLVVVAIIGILAAPCCSAALLVANGIEIPCKENNKRMNSEEIFALASPSTVYLACWGKN